VLARANAEHEESKSAREVDELEREREERRREFLAAHETRRAERLKQTAAEENARNRRVPARS
jgi:hypothetical protein